MRELADVFGRALSINVGSLAVFAVAIDATDAARFNQIGSDELALLPNSNRFCAIDVENRALPVRIAFAEIANKFFAVCKKERSPAV